MKRTIMLSAAFTAGLFLLAQGAAFATNPSPSPSPTSSASPAPSESPNPPTNEPWEKCRIVKPLTISPAKGRPGDKVKVDFQIDAGGDGAPVESVALEVDTFKKTGLVKNVKPGKYKVKIDCLPEPTVATFEVLPPKGQVAKIPSGAPQTGGTEGPAENGQY